MTEIHIDTEFLEDGRTIDLISIGMVKETGETYYAVNADMPVDAVRNHHWLRKNVWCYLPHRKSASGLVDDLDLDNPDVKPIQTIRAEVLRFISDTPNPSLWAWYSAFDHVALSWLYGPMINMPPTIPQRTNDVAQEWERLGYPRMPEQPTGNHHALEDAKFCLFRRIWLKEYEKQLRTRHDQS